MTFVEVRQISIDKQLNPEKRRVLLRIWLTGLSVSLLMPVAGYSLGRAGDCKPGQIDGQCGMSTFFMLIFGIFTGLLILVAVTAYVTLNANRHRKHP
jgi:hypothetical protein